MAVMVHMYGDEKEVDEFFYYFQKWCFYMDYKFDLFNGLDRCANDKVDDKHFNVTVDFKFEIPDDFECKC